MALLKIARMGHPVLVRKAVEVPDPTSRDIRRLVEDMIETMDDAEGVGLAAPQVHLSQRVMIFKSPPGRAGEDDPLSVIPLTALINPEIEPLTDEMVDGFEGCLSIPGLTGVVPRYARIGYRGYSPRGELIEREATGFHARVVQHELDHLNGVLYTMRMADLRLLSFTEELRHLTREEPAEDADDADAESNPA
jgi:peptide deformylase